MRSVPGTVLTADRGRIFLLSIILGLCFVVVFGASCARAPNPRGEKHGSGFAPPVPQVWQLPNGLTVMFMEDRELPLVSGTLLLKGGGLWEPDSHPALAEALGSEMRDGGAGYLGAEQLDQRLRDLSSEISTSFGDESGTVGFSSLSSDFPEVFSLVSDIVLRPRFEIPRLELWKARAIDGIRRRSEDSEVVAGLAFQQLVYGDTPYGRVAAETDIRKIGREELLNLHRRFVVPNQAILAVSGDISSADLQSLVVRHFGQWEKAASPIEDFPPLGFEPAPGIYFVRLPFQQATVSMGMQGVPRLSHDMMAIELFNEIFGSGRFGSRLFKKVRSELGLSYSVSGGVYAGPVRGINSVSLQTKGPAVGRSIIESLAVLRDLQNREIYQEELVNARRVLENSFVFKFDSRAEVVRRRAYLRFLQYPLDYYETYLSRIGEVSTRQIQDVAAERWNFGKFVVVVVGDENAYNSLQAALPEFPGELRKGGVKLARFDQRLILE